MDFGADRVSGAVNEIVAVPGFLDVVADGAIDFPACHGASAGDAIDHRIDADVARVTHDGENFSHAVRRGLTDETGPCDVVINGAGSILFRPNVEQNEVALANGRGAFHMWLVVRIAAISIDGYD